MLGWRKDGPEIIFNPQTQQARERIAAEDPNVVDMRSWYAEESRTLDQTTDTEPLVFSWVGLQTCCAQLHVADHGGKRHIVASHSLQRHTNTGNARWLLREAGLRRQTISRQAGAAIRRVFTRAETEPAADAAVCSIIMHTRREPALGMILQLKAFGLTSEHIRLTTYRDQMRTMWRRRLIDPGCMTVTVPPTGPLTYVMQGSSEENALEPQPVTPGVWSAVAGSVAGYD